MLADQLLSRARERLTSISWTAPVKDAAALMARPHTDLVVVCGQDGGMMGVLTKTNIAGQITRCVGSGCTANIDAIMTQDVASRQPDEPLRNIWSMMKAPGVKRIPIVDQGGKPIGIICARDALRSFLGEVENDEALLRDYLERDRLRLIQSQT